MQKSSFLLYSNLILSLHIVYELNSWPRNQTNTFPIKKCLFGIVKLIRHTIKSKCTYNGQGTAFDGKVHWFLVMTLLEMLWYLVLIIFNYLIVIIKKSWFLVLGEGPTYGINDNTGVAERHWY